MSRTDRRRFRESTLGVLVLAGSVLLSGVAVLATEGLPEGVEPLSPEREAKLQRLVEVAESLRSLPSGERMPVGQQSVEGLERYLASALEEELPPESVPGVEAILKWFGVIPEELSLPDFFIELLSSQVAGYYDPPSGYLVVVDGPDSVAAAFADNPALAERMDGAILLHEIVHYLQDEHFDLEAFMGKGLLGDGVVARQALVEGDATLAMYSYILGTDFERIGFIGPVFESLLEDPSSLIELAPDLPGAGELLEAPAYFRETLIFPYLRGLLFNLEVRQRGGTKLLDYAYTSDPPRSSEQILHPEKWLDERDEPIELTLPEVVGLGSDRLELVESGSWGELGIRILLGVRLGESKLDEAEAAALGWGGDGYALYSSGESRYLAWVTEWDRPKDADEFEAVASVGFADWRVERASETRVVLVDSAAGAPEGAAAAPDGAPDGPVADRAAELESTLAGAFATTPAERAETAPIDFAALGIGEADVPEPMGILDLLELAEDPAMGELFDQGVDLGQQGAFAEMMADPEVQAKVVEMFASMEPEELTELMSHPMMQQVIEQQRAAMMENRPEVAIAQGVLTVESLGVRLNLPNGDGWEVVDDPNTGTINAVHPDGAGLLVAIVPVPPGSPLEAVTMGLDSQFLTNGFEKTVSDHSDFAGYPSYLAGFRHPTEPQELDIRFVHIGGQGLSVTAFRAVGVVEEELVGELMTAFGSLTIVP